MKILFTADWHLGYTLGSINRLDDQIRQIRMIAAYVDEHGVDVLAIAGDVFEAQERGPARAAAAAMMHELAPALARGVRIIAVAGNHDRDYFMEMANLWLSAAAPGGSDRVILRTRPELVTITLGDESVNFALLPFPTAARYELKQDDAGGAGQRNEQLAKLFGEKMEELRKEAAEQRLPTVLLTHVVVGGSEVRAHRLAPRDDVLVARSAFPAFELTIIGHIHKPEQLGGGHFYYVGGLDRMDIGERDYDSRVLLADIGPQGVREITSLPLDPTPFAGVIATDDESLVAAHGAMPRPNDTLVKLTLQVPVGTYTAPLQERARQLFPRLYGNVEHDWQGAEALTPSVAGLNPANVEETVRSYLEEQKLPTDELAAMLELVTELRHARTVQVEA